MTRYPQHRRATQMLLLSTLFWGISFPTMKALTLAQHRLLPESSSWFVTASAVTVRFGIAAIVLMLWSRATLRRITRSEIWQGAGLGAFAAAGMILQMDGLAYTSASTSAFLTQCSCLIVPIVVAFRDRRWPSAWILACLAMVVAGVAILAKVDWRTLRMGRGEIETLLGSLAFTGQILWLERPRFARNRVSHFTFVMFAAMALFALPLGLFTMETWRDWPAAYSAPSAVGLVGILVVFCTLTAFVLMNHWQPQMPVTEAGLIYTAEPVFASLFALFLPAWFSAMAAIDYSNEIVNWNLVVGGGLITAANLLIQLKASPHAGIAPVPAKLAAQ